MKVLVKKLNENYKLVIVEDELKVGDGVTVNYYSDQEPYTVINIDPKGRWIDIQKDHAVRIDPNRQSYKFERDPNGRIQRFYKTRRKDFTLFTDTGRYTYNEYGAYLTLKKKEKYFDYSF